MTFGECSGGPPPVTALQPKSHTSDLIHGSPSVQAATGARSYPSWWPMSGTTREVPAGEEEPSKILQVLS